MKLWFTAKDLAGLPGLPDTPQGINQKGKREGWQSRKRQGREKAWEYYLDTLPAPTRDYLARKNNEAKTEAIMAELYPDEPVTIPGEQTRDDLAAKQEAESKKIRNFDMKYAALPKGCRKKKFAKARMWVLGYVRRYSSSHYSKATAYIMVSRDFQNNTIPMPEWMIEFMPTYGGRRSLSAKSIELWNQKYSHEGIWGLTDRNGNRAGQSIIETNKNLFRLVIGAMIYAPQISARSISEFICANNKKRVAAGQAALPEVHQRTCGRFKSRWIEENEQLWIKIINPDRWKNMFMVAAGSHSEAITRLNQLWELDSTPADWMLKDGRHSVVGVIDIYSRRLKFFVSKTSKAMAVCQLTRLAMMDWGICEGVRTDNGQDYISDQFEIVLDGLEIQHHICIPFASEEKGTIERAMRTLSHGILNLLPGFIGHNVAERKQIEARKSFSTRMMKHGDVIDVEMSADDLQQHLDDWCKHSYGNDQHASIAMSPNEKARAWRDGVRRIENERALDMLLSEVAGTRKIGKKGVHFKNHTYFNEDMGQYIGKRAMIKYDESDIGRLYAYVEEKFIGVLLCHEILGISRREAAIAVKVKQKKMLAVQTAEYRAYAREIKSNMAETVLDYRVAESENVVALPQPSEPYVTTGLTEAARAVAGDSSEAGPAFNSTPLSAEEQAVADQINAEAAEETTPVAMFGVDPARDFALWKRLDARMQHGETLIGREHDIWKHYQKSDEFKSLLELEAVFAAENGS